jgi:cellulose synthase/poly-beta-1,6-N-acetylglucosamine synthase-like glycosyltransferase
MGLLTVLIYPALFLSLFFEVFLLLSFLEGKRANPKPGKREGDLPTVTIFIPCYNEARTAGKTIESLLALDYPKDKLSIFAINDGSTDSTAEVLASYAHEPQVQIFSKENGGKFSALNLGLTHATSELVGCLDADSTVAPDALSEIVRYFSADHIMAVTPGIKIMNPKSIVQHVQHAEYALSAFIRRTFSWMDSLFITPGPFSIFRRSVFTELGPYKEAHMTEDMEIALRMQSHNMKIENAPTAVVYTNAPRSYKALFKQRVRWTYGFMKNARDYRFMFFNRNYGTLGLFLLPMGLFTIFPAIYFTAISVAYAGTNLSATVDQIRVVGFSVPHLPTLDWFFFNTHAFLILTWLLFASTILLIFIGKSLMGDRKHFGRDVALYLVLYGFLAPWWLAKAVYNVAVARPKSWREEIDERRLGTE